MKAGIFASGVWCFCKSKGVADEMDYRAELYKIFDDVENLEFLEFVYRFVKRLKENWGI